MALALLLAVCANRPLKGLGIMKAALFLPMVTSTVAIAMVWYWLYAPDYGMINTVLYQLFGIAGPGWLTTMEWSKPAVILMTVWRGMGYTFIIFLAGLKGISREYYEAAELDGAGEISKFFRITFPLLSPVIFFVMVTMHHQRLRNLQRGVHDHQGRSRQLHLYRNAVPVQLCFQVCQNGAGGGGFPGDGADADRHFRSQFALSRRWVNYGA
jgi:ABC-type sugar transport system permease subunit